MGLATVKLYMDQALTRTHQERLGERLVGAVLGIGQRMGSVPECLVVFSKESEPIPYPFRMCVMRG